MPLQYLAKAGWIAAGIVVIGVFASRRRWLPWGVLCLLLMVPSLAATGDLNSALAGFLALGISVLGFLVWGRRWLAPYVLVAAAVLLVLLLAPDSYTAFGLLFDLLVAGALVLLVRARGLGGLVHRPAPVWA